MSALTSAAREELASNADGSFTASWADKQGCLWIGGLGRAEVKLGGGSDARLALGPHGIHCIYSTLDSTDKAAPQIVQWLAPGTEKATRLTSEKYDWGSVWNYDQKGQIRLGGRASGPVVAAWTDEEGVAHADVLAARK